MTRDSEVSFDQTLAEKVQLVTREDKPSDHEPPAAIMMCRSEDHLRRTCPTLLQHQSLSRNLLLLGVTSISQACVNLGEGSQLTKAPREKEVWPLCQGIWLSRAGFSVGEACHQALKEQTLDTNFNAKMAFTMAENSQSLRG